MPNPVPILGYSTDVNELPRWLRLHTWSIIVLGAFSLVSLIYGAISHADNRLTGFACYSPVGALMAFLQFHGTFHRFRHNAQCAAALQIIMGLLAAFTLGANSWEAIHDRNPITFSFELVALASFGAIYATAMLVGGVATWRWAKKLPWPAAD